jgi:polysaccharide biosynthesis transport protein
MIKQLVSSYIDEFRRFLWTLFPEKNESVSRVVQMTACSHGEGVTTVSLAFADFVSRLWGPDQVVVVEANLRRPTFGKIVDLGSCRTLTDALSSDCAIRDAVSTSNTFGFTVVPARGLAADDNSLAVEALLEHLGTSIAELKKKYRLVIVDSPAVVPYLDANIISAATDGTVFVVEANETRRQVLDFAIDKMKSAEANILGMILNKRELHIPRWVYQYL